MNPGIRILKLVRRNVYSLRLLIPGLREQHKIETMVGPLGVWAKCRAYQINCLKKCGLKPHHFLADIGCGPLQGGVAFIKYLDTSRYIGIDINHSKLDAAYRQVGYNGLSYKNPRLIISNSFGKNELGTEKIDFFWVSQILYHFTEEYVVNLFKMVCEHSHKSSVLYADIIGLEHHEHKTNEYGMVLHSVSSLQEIVKKFGFTVESIGKIADYGYPKRLVLSTNLLLKFSYISK